MFDGRGTLCITAVKRCVLRSSYSLFDGRRTISKALKTFYRNAILSGAENNNGGFLIAESHRFFIVEPLY